MYVRMYIHTKNACNSIDRSRSTDGICHKHSRLTSAARCLARNTHAHAFSLMLCMQSPHACGMQHVQKRYTEKSLYLFFCTFVRVRVILPVNHFPLSDRPPSSSHTTHRLSDGCTQVPVYLLYAVAGISLCKSTLVRRASVFACTLRLVMPAVFACTLRLVMPATQSVPRLTRRLNTKLCATTITCRCTTHARSTYARVAHAYMMKTHTHDVDGIVDKACLSAAASKAPIPVVTVRSARV